MGQQQLLLLVIGVVIVGFSTMAAFYILQNSYQKDEADGLLDRSLSIATHAVYWKSKNDPFAGGNQSYNRLAEEGLQLLALDETNVRGTYRIAHASGDELRVAGISTRYENVGVCVVVNRYDVERSFVRFDGAIGSDGDCLPAEDS